MRTIEISLSAAASLQPSFPQESIPSLSRGADNSMKTGQNVCHVISQFNCTLKMLCLTLEVRCHIDFDGQTYMWRYLVQNPWNVNCDATVCCFICLYVYKVIALHTGESTGESPVLFNHKPLEPLLLEFVTKATFSVIIHSFTSSQKFHD